MFKNKVDNSIFDTIDLNNVEIYKKPIILDFGGTFCSPCKKYEKTLEKVKEEYEDNVLIQLFDVSKDIDIAFKYNVSTIPHQVFIDTNGKIINNHIGILSYNETIDLLEKCGLKK